MFDTLTRMGASGVSTGYQIARSLRFNPGDSPYLARTPGTAGNQRVWTYSCWFKLCGGLGGHRGAFLKAGGDANNYFKINIASDDKLYVLETRGGAYSEFWRSDRLVRDMTGWQHLVLRVDTTDSTTSDRVRVYINGIEQSGTRTHNPTLNFELFVNGNAQHEVGASTVNSQYFDGYIADPIFLDGSTLAPSSFAETHEDTGQWVPKEFDDSSIPNGSSTTFSDTWTASGNGFGSAPVTRAYAGDLSSFANNSAGGQVLTWNTSTYNLSGNLKIYCYSNSGVYDIYVNGNATKVADTPSESGNVAWVDCGTFASITEIQFAGTTYNTDNGLGATGVYFSGFMVNGTFLRDDMAPYGTNGFHLTLSDNSNTTATTLGTDSAGSNNLTPNNFATTDSVPDSPTNNFCTGNPIGRVYTGALGNNPSYSEGALEFETTGNSSHAFGTIAVNRFLTSGCYFEVLLDDIDVDRSYVGIVDHQSSLNDASYGFVNKALMRHNGLVYKEANIDDDDYWDTGVADCVAGDIIGVAVKGTSIWFHKNGTYYPNSSGSTGNPSTGANATVTSITKITSEDYLPYAGYNSDYTWNFGQDSSFAGAKTAQNNTDANGIGDFHYPVPTGFVALCASNLPEPTITKSTDYFDTLLYTGNNGSQNITGLGFDPNFVWAKNREDAGYHHDLYDTIRGDNLRIYSSQTNAEGTGYLQFGVTGGFSLTAGGGINNNGSDHVAWNWRGGTAGSGSTSGSGTAKTYTSNYNATAGFSITKYTGNGTSGHTIPHSLGVAPDVIMVKRTSGVEDWVVYCGEIEGDAGFYIKMETGAGSNAAAGFNSTNATSSVFTLGDNTVSNGNNDTYIAYAFSSVAGYSKFGKYIGNGNADGPMVYLGFRPAMIITKRLNDTSNWYTFDNKRETYNPRDYRMELQSNAVEYGPYDNLWDFVSNGMKLRSSNSGSNDSNDKYLYMAWAASPVKYSNAGD